MGEATLKWASQYPEQLAHVRSEMLSGAAARQHSSSEMQYTNTAMQHNETAARADESSAADPAGKPLPLHDFLGRWFRTDDSATPDAALQQSGKADGTEARCVAVVAHKGIAHEP